MRDGEELQTNQDRQMAIIRVMGVGADELIGILSEEGILDTVIDLYSATGPQTSMRVGEIVEYLGADTFECIGVVDWTRVEDPLQFRCDILYHTFSKLGVTSSRYWDTEQLETLGKLIASGNSDKEIAEEMGRSENSIKLVRLNHLNESRITKVEWTADEEERLTQYYQQGLSDSEIAAKIRFTQAQVHWRRTVLGLEPKRQSVDEGTVREIQRLKDSGLTKNDISRRLGFSKPQVAFICRKFNILFSQRGRIWDPDEQQILLKMRVEGRTYKEIATTLGRSRSSVKTKFQKLKRNNFNLTHKMSPWRTDETQHLQDLYNAGHTQVQIAQIMNRSTSIISSRLNALFNEQ